MGAPGDSHPRPEAGRTSGMVNREEQIPAVDVLRDELGATAALWAGALHAVEPDRWVALSQATAVEYNLIVCHGAQDTHCVAASVEEIGMLGVPTLLALAGRALGSAQVAVDAGLVCVGDRAFMARAGAGSALDPDVRQARLDELPAVREVMVEAFETTPELVAVALPDPDRWPTGTRVWLLESEGGIKAVTGAVQAGSALAIWSMATRPSEQHRGYGRRLLDTVLCAGVDDGADHSVLITSPVGESLYRSLGYSVVERWQQWSRPRWVLGRT